MVHTDIEIDAQASESDQECAGRDESANGSDGNSRPTTTALTTDADGRQDGPPSPTAAENSAGEPRERSGPGRDNIPSALAAANATRGANDERGRGEGTPAETGSSADPSFADKLNVALESLESMRRLNLEVEFSDAGSPFPVNHDRCTYAQREELQECLRDPARWEKDKAGRGVQIGNARLDGSRLRRFGRNVSGLFSRSVANASGNNDSKSALFKSCPPSLEDKGEASATCVPSGVATGDPTRRNLLRKLPRPCLTCGQPTCARHAAPEFSKNHVTLCKTCANLFDLDFLVDIIIASVADAKACQRKVDNLIDCYDRTRLLLLYAAQYSERVASSLEAQTARSNKVGVGASATGVVSGVAGVVGCGALLLPPVAVVGVPLLIASLVLGGSATATQTGDAAAQYFSEPKRLATRMLALHGMALSLLRIVEVLTHALLRERLSVNYSLPGHSRGAGGETTDDAGDDGTQREALRRHVRELLETHGAATTQVAVGGMQSAVTTGIVAAELAAAGAATGAAEASAMSAAATGASALGRNGRYLGRAGAAAGRTARFVPVVGGVLSVACVYVEGRELGRTLRRINEGSPCELARRVREVAAEAGRLPDSAVVAGECRRVFEMAAREGELRGGAEREAGGTSSDRIGGGMDEGGDMLRDVDTCDISDMISVMETSVSIYALGEAQPSVQTEAASTA